MQIPCVVLAGGKAKPEMIAATGQENRAMVVVNGKTLLAHVTDALLAAPECAEITVVGNLPSTSEYTTIHDQGGFVENVFAGTNAHREATFLLIATSDLPFITGPIISDFVREAVVQAEASGAALIYPAISVPDCYARFPGVKRTALKLREGELTGGNLMLVRPSFLLQQRERIANAYAARKSPLRLAMMLGMDTVLRLLISQLGFPDLLTVPFLEARVARLLGCPVRALISPHPEIATDLDRPSDFAAVGLPAPS